jgi:O-antigen ligase
VYNELGMPFGVFGEIGQIDNNWFSIWGEYGTIGVLIYLAIFLSVLKHAYTEYFQTQSKVVKTLHLIVIGSVMGVLVQGFFAPYFEMRTLMYLVWILASMSILAGQQRIMTNTK